MSTVTETTPVVAEVPVVAHKKRNTLPNADFIKIWNSPEVHSLKEFCEKTGISEAMAAVRKSNLKKNYGILLRKFSKVGKTEAEINELREIARQMGAEVVDLKAAAVEDKTDKAPVEGDKVSA